MSMESNGGENSPQYDALLDADVRDEAVQAVVETAQNADVVRINGNAGDIHARQVTIENGGVARVMGEAVTLNMKNGGVGMATAATLDVLLENGGVGAAVARTANIKGGNIMFMAAGKVSLAENSRVLFDLRAGALAGVVSGMFIGLIYAVTRLRVGRPRMQPQPQTQARTQLRRH